MELLLENKQMKMYCLDIPEINKSIKQSLKRTFMNGTTSSYAVAFLVTSDLNTGLAGLDAAGYKILGVLYSVGYWVIAVKAIYEIIQKAMKGDRRGAGQVIITYVVIYGALFAVPWALRQVRGIF